MTPAVVKEIKWTLQKCRTNPREPKPTRALCTPPDYMSDSAKEAWNYAAHSPPGLLSALDGAVLKDRGKPTRSGVAGAAALNLFSSVERSGSVAN